MRCSVFSGSVGEPPWINHLVDSWDKNWKNRSERTLQGHCTENSKQIFPGMKLCGHVPNFHIHVSLSLIYISTISPPILLQQIG